MKTNITRILFFVLTIGSLAACGPQASATPAAQGDNPYAAQASDSELMRGDVTIDSSSLAVGESQPPQVTLNFAYSQPTPCYQLRVEVSQPDTQKRIDVTTYAVAEKDKPCSLMALATPLQASLDLGSYPPGHYSVWLNGTEVGEFD